LPPNCLYSFAILHLLCEDLLDTSPGQLGYSPSLGLITIPIYVIPDRYYSNGPENSILSEPVEHYHETFFLDFVGLFIYQFRYMAKKI
jgi:hypothetical protein